LTFADLHLFSPEQPDLNWDTQAVRDAVADVCDFWLEKGVNGFRVSLTILHQDRALLTLLQMDVINLISKTPGLPDAPVTDSSKYEQNATSFFTNGYDPNDQKSIGMVHG